MSEPSKWSDLAPRLASGVAMAAGGGLLVWLGGPWFAALATVAGAVMVWELAAMTDRARPDEAVVVGAVAAMILGVVALTRDDPWLAPLLLLPSLYGLLRPKRPMRLVFAVYAALIMLACYGLVAFREAFGPLWLLWLILVVVVTDIAGYFAGRMIGGPKFWPRISPKKTWSGTVAGWLGAALVGAVFLRFSSAGIDLLWISALLALASQMGDIAESAIKRRCGVKDSSNLIPGHGGLMDRFDGLLGAALLMLLVALMTDVPSVRF